MMMTTHCVQHFEGQVCGVADQAPGELGVRLADACPKIGRTPDNISERRSETRTNSTPTRAPKNRLAIDWLHDRRRQRRSIERSLAPPAIVSS
jgi:hypothetical protein